MALSLTLANRRQPIPSADPQAQSKFVLKQRFIQFQVSGFCDASDLTCLMVTCRMAKQIFSHDLYWKLKADALYVKVLSPLQPNIGSYYNLQKIRMLECLCFDSRFHLKEERLVALPYTRVLALTIKTYSSNFMMVETLQKPIQKDLVEFFESITGSWSNPSSFLDIEECFVEAAKWGAIKILKSISSKKTISRTTKIRALDALISNLKHGLFCEKQNNQLMTFNFLMDGEILSDLEKREIFSHIVWTLRTLNDWKPSVLFSEPISYDVFEIIMLFKDYGNLPAGLTWPLFRMAVHVSHQKFIEWKLDQINEYEILECCDWMLEHRKENAGLSMVLTRLALLPEPIRVKLIKRCVNFTSNRLQSDLAERLLSLVPLSKKAVQELETLVKPNQLFFGRILALLSKMKV